MERQRAAEQAARERQRAFMGAMREAERARKAYERAQALEAKERQRLYLAAREAEINALNEALAAKNESLERLLHATLELDA